MIDLGRRVPSTLGSCVFVFGCTGSPSSAGGDAATDAAETSSSLPDADSTMSFDADGTDDPSGTATSTTGATQTAGESDGSTSEGGTTFGGGWTEIEGPARLIDVCPGPQSNGWGACKNVVDAYSGGTVLDDTFYIWGGGHGDYTGNELYAIDLGSGEIEIVFPQTDPIPDDAHASCMDAWFGDPASRHTYGGMAGIPSTETHPSMLFVHAGIVACGSGGEVSNTWLFDPAARTWTDLGVLANNVGRGPSQCIHVAQEDLVYCTTSLDGWFTAASFDPDTKSWTTIFPVFERAAGGGSTAYRDGVLWILGIGGDVRRLDLSTRVLEPVNTTGGELLVDACAAWDYDPVHDKFLAYTGMIESIDTSTVFVLDPVSLAWEVVESTGGPALNTGQSCMYDRWTYAPAVDAFVVVNAMDQHAFAFRLDADAGR